MGKHFDSLVDMVEQYIKEKDASRNVYDRKNSIPKIKEYLISLIQRATLLEFPLNAEELLPRSGQVKKEYDKKMFDYFNFSEQLGCHFHLPFDVTAVEDNDSVVMVENLEGITFRVIACRLDKINRHEYISLVIGNVDFRKPERFPMLFPVLPLYAVAIEEGERKPDEFFLDPELRRYIAQDVLTSAVSYVEQIVYTMDPENLLLEKQNINESGKNVNGLEKSNRRIHYFCVSQKDALELLGEQRKESIYIAVKGTERFLQNQRELIEELISGNGRAITPDGWHLRLMVKESPTRMVPYK